MKEQQDHDIDIRPFAYAISFIDGKWKMHILFWLWKKEIMRYSELKRALGSVSHKMLSNQMIGAWKKAWHMSGFFRFRTSIYDGIYKSLSL